MSLMLTWSSGPLGEARLRRYRVVQGHSIRLACGTTLPYGSKYPNTKYIPETISTNS